MTNLSQTATRTAILVPTPLRKYTDGQARVEVEAGTVGEALAALAARYPTLEKQLYDDAGALRSFVNVYLGDEDVRYLDGPETPLDAGATLSIVPSIAGGI